MSKFNFKVEQVVRTLSWQKAVVIAKERNEFNFNASILGLNEEEWSGDRLHLVKDVLPIQDYTLVSPIGHEYAVMGDQCFFPDWALIPYLPNETLVKKAKQLLHVNI